MQKWLIPGAGVLAAVAAIAVAVVVVASPFDSDDTTDRTTADTSAENGGDVTDGDTARCAAEATDCVDPNGGDDISSICAADVDPEECNDTPEGDGGSLNMCIAGAEDCEDTVTDPGASGSEPATDARASEAAILALAARLDVKPEAVAIVSNEPTEWPDACLGVQQDGVLCAQVITPGYKVLLEHDGTQYEYHTDTGGTAIPAN